MSSLQWNQYSQMNNTVLKTGYLEKFSKGFMGEKWKKVYVTLYKDSSLFWFKNKGDSTSKGNVNLQNVCRYLTCGANVRAIPHSPTLPGWASIDHVLAFPQQPSKKSQIHYFLCSDQAEFDAWMNVIVSTLPPPPSNQAQQQQPPPPQNTHPPPAYAPTPQTHAPPPTNPAYPQPPANAPFYPQPPGAGGGGGIGFEAIGMPTPAPPGQPYPQATSPYPAGPPPPGGYAPPPPASYPQQPPSYPQAPRPQPAAYPQQQHYPAYPTQQQQQQQPYHSPAGYPQQQHGYSGGQPHYQAGYAPHQGQQPAANTTVVYKNHKPKKSKGTGKMLAGLAGGAVAGYAASRMFRPFGGFGWGHGSWGSGSWGSFSGGSFGSFGSFGSD